MVLVYHNLLLVAVCYSFGKFYNEMLNKLLYLKHKNLLRYSVNRLVKYISFYDIKLIVNFIFCIIYLQIIDNKC